MHALVGANGAGKSTLGKIVGGVIRPDEGQLFVDDRPVRYTSPSEARVAGIATIAQELSPVPQMSVIENVFLGIEPRRRGLVQRSQMRRQFEELVSHWGFELEPSAIVGGLRTADKQKVEILRAVACDARVIVMDEPTSSLTSVETETLHQDDPHAPRQRQDDRLRQPLPRRGARARRYGHRPAQRAPRTRPSPATEETEESLVAGMFGAAAAAEHFDKPQQLDSAAAAAGERPAP